MNTQNPDCMGNYDFDHIARYAYQRFIEGYSLLDLFKRAKSHRQRQEMTLVSELTIENNTVETLHLICQYKEQCKATGCRSKLKNLLEQSLRNP